MVEYTLEEAAALLEENKRAAQETLKQVDEDLAFVRDQVNTTEVSITRVYNFDVKLRKGRDEAAHRQPPRHRARLGDVVVLT